MTMAPPPVVFDLLVLGLLIGMWVLFGWLPYYLTGGRER